MPGIDCVAAMEKANTIKKLETEYVADIGLHVVKRKHFHIII